MKGYWDPEFEPSVEEIVDYMAILSVSFLWRAHTQGNFLIQHMAGGGHVRANWLKPRAPIYTCTEHVQFVDVSLFKLWWRTVACFHEGRGI